ncbi:hypothetical protein FEC26_18845, partial [Acinetobacter baumannii]
YILKFYYKKGKNATQAAKKNCDVYGPSAVSVRVAQIWFKRFQSGNFDVKDARRSGLAYTKKLDIWVPHELTERNLMNRVLICDSLLRRNETEPFLKKLITGDEKWITYDKNVRERLWSKAGQASQTLAKPGLTRNKVMLCVWWDWKGIIHYELLPPGRTIDSELYCEQLMRLKQEVERKRPELINRRGVVFHHDNARPHTSLATQQKLRELGWEVLMHPPYSSDLARFPPVSVSSEFFRQCQVNITRGLPKPIVAVF